MILDVSDLSYAYNGTDVLKDVGFSVHKGEVLVILGPNGAGKTTLLKCLNRILHPKTGQVRVKGRPVQTMGVREIAREIAYVAQKPEGGKVSVFDAILMGRIPHLGFRPSREDLEKTGAVMERLRLSDMGVKYLDRLSGGELQKVAIARALVQETDILLMDEPTASLDLKNQTDILGLVRAVAKSHDIAVVMTMHDLNAALRYADQYICLKDHEICGAGNIGEISPALVSRVYGIPVEIVHHRGCPMVVPADPPGQAGHAA
ncbi:MAG: ABC transporter ATP-binding protein [Desulfobacter sp.]